MCLLNTSVLNVSVNHCPPFCRLYRSNRPADPPKLNFSMEAELLSILEQKCHFKANLIDGHDAWGLRTGNGTWTGAIGQVVHGHSDFAMCGLTQTEERLQAVDYSSYVYMDEVAFIVQSPGLVDRGHFFAQPFGSVIWMTILVFFVINSGLIYVKNRILGFLTVAIRFYGIWVNQSIRKIRSEQILSTRMIYSTSIMSALVLTNTYSSIFYSILTIPKYGAPVDTIADLVRVAERDTHRILALKDTSQLSEFIHASPQNRVFYSIGRHINRTGAPMIGRVKDQILVVAQDPKNIVVSGRLFLEEKRVLSRKMLHISSENLAVYYTGVILPKKSPLKEPFDVIIKQIQSIGLFHYWTKRVSTQQRHQSNLKTRRKTAKQFTLYELKSIFYALLYGIAISSLCLIIEILFPIFHFVWYNIKRFMLILVLAGSFSSI